MILHNHVFDPYLDHVNADDIKRMVRIWGGTYKMRKTECIELINESLRDPDLVQKMVEHLPEFKRNALALVHFMGGVMHAEALMVGLQMTDIKSPESKQGYLSVTQRMLQPLLHAGLILLLREQTGKGYYYGSPISLSYSFNVHDVNVFTDHRILRFAPAFPQCKPLTLKPAPAPATTLVRPPQTVLLDILGMLQAIDAMGGLGMTKTDTVRVSDVRKLGKAMGWSGTDIEIGGLPFHEPALGFAVAMSASGLLTRQGDTLHLTSTPEEFADGRYSKQITPLVRGFLHANGWNEQEVIRKTTSYDIRSLAGRVALIMALAALPTDTDSFFSLSDIDLAIFGRIGEMFSFRHQPSSPSFFRSTSQAERKEQELQWRVKLRQDWLKYEREWFRTALTSWVFALGLVEIGMDGQTPVSVRLTDLGRNVLHPHTAVWERIESGEARAAWVVQPTFEMIVYLNQTTPQQLAFLERHAERTKVEQHMAHYRLTRDSVYQGLEQGSSLDDIVAQLRTGSAMELPQNVETEVRTWAALRERIAVYRQARLVEFATQADRDAALQGNLNGKAVGERFVLLAASAPIPEYTGSTIDYTQPLPACLYVAEDGTLDLRVAPDALPDLLIAAQLDRWAEPVEENRWQLTANSVSTALDAKAELHELQQLIESRAVRSVPNLLTEVLRCWSGMYTPVGLASVTVLQCKRSELLDAIAKSKMFKPAIRGRLGSDVLLVDSQMVEQLREMLIWTGVTIGETIHRH